MNEAKSNQLGEKKELFNKAISQLTEGYIIPEITVSEQQIFNELPRGIFEILQQFDNFNDFASWMEVVCQDAGDISSMRADQLIALAYLFGFESKPDKGIEHSLATKVKNSQVPLLTSIAIDNLFYSYKNYEQSQSIEDIHAYLKSRFLSLCNFSGEQPIRQFSRIKQEKSLIEKVRSVLKNKGVDNTDKFSDRELLAAAIKMEKELSEIPNWFDSLRYFDDLIGFYFIIDDVDLTNDERKIALTQVVERLMSATDNLANTQKVVLERKQSRAPSFEAVNIYIYGQLDHKFFGALPVKLQIRFERCLWQESAMYYMYKMYKKWEMPPWASKIDFTYVSTFRELQERLFQNFKEWFNHFK